MDVRERLVELQLQADIADNVSENTTQHREFTADFMMANGVTVQEWISVKDRLPDKHGDYLTYAPRYGYIEIYYYMDRDEWDHHRNGITDAQDHGFTHWMPLPQPPKGE